MTKAEIGMLVMVILFGAALLVGLGLIRSGDLPSMTFWTGGVMGIMGLFSVIAAFGIKNPDP